MWSYSHSSLFTERLTLILPPPAHPTVSTPSSSESILISFLPVIYEVSSPRAPSIPTSSQTVNMTSSLGCFTLLESSIARPYANAIPSSPPRVVPLAVT